MPTKTALNHRCASFYLELQRNKDTGSCTILAAKVQGHRQEQLMLTLDVRLLKIHLFSMNPKHHPPFRPPKPNGKICSTHPTATCEISLRFVSVTSRMIERKHRQVRIRTWVQVEVGKLLGAPSGSTDTLSMELILPVLPPPPI